MSTYSDDYVNKLQAELANEQAKRQALVEEFRTSLEDFSPEDIKKKFKELAPDAYQTVIYLMGNAESESVRASLARWVMNVVMELTDDSADNTLKELLTQLAKA